MYANSVLAVYVTLHRALDSEFTDHLHSLNTRRYLSDRAIDAFDAHSIMFANSIIDRTSVPKVFTVVSLP